LVLVDGEAAGPPEWDLNPQSGTLPDHLAYVIYTSGSTGRPKGVAVTHANVARLFKAAEAIFDFNERDAWTLFHSYAFDFSVWELWGALLYGGRLVVVPYWVSRSPEAFLDLLADRGVTVLNQTPSAFRQLQRADGERPRDLMLRWVIFGGEALEPASLAPWFERHGDRAPRLVNMYGITETTVHVTWQVLESADCESAVSGIGRPLADLGAHILDGALEPAPIGVPGDLFVSGAGLARGYLRRPALTAERFRPDPFGVQPGARMYHSGDLARYGDDGRLHYLGRTDHQVKIRGFRIELGEIEARLAEHPAIAEAAVIARGEGDERHLAAYLAMSDAGLTAAELRRHLEQRLPAYMVPAAFVMLERLPLTGNGKLDRGALPEVDAALPLGTVYAAPEGETERLIADVWARALGLERIGVNDNFFDMGAHSLLMIQVHQSLRERLGRNFPLVGLFQYPNVKALAAWLEHEPGGNDGHSGVAERVERRKAALQRRRGRS
jgi:amino acid adenylation domain-containing protein